MDIKRNLHRVILIYLTVLFIWSGYNAYDRLTWYMEVAPAVIGLFVLFAISKKFCFTNFTFIFIAIEMSILLIGGKYTYARVPLFDLLSEFFSFERNYYDRLGHFAQGFVPALVSREVILRKNIVNGGAWMFWIVISICMAISAAYELVEFTAAHILKRGADDFLGTQGSVWDTQWDMLWATVGAFVAQICLSAVQDRQIDRIEGEQYGKI